MTKIGIIGGTGPEGLGLAMRFAKAGDRVFIGSRAQERAERLGLRGLDVSMSHSREYAVAFVVGQSEEMEPDRESWRQRLIGILRERGLLE
jgi:predicted dinucleotide-binding enzyme